MSILRPFCATDVFRFNNINLDQWTETYSIDYYLGNLLNWPEMFSVQESSSGMLMGYVMGKKEGDGKDWHGHVTAISVSPGHRGMSLAKGLMESLERISELERAWFVDLFVRVTNQVAIGMYESMGYSVYRRVIAYYGDDEDAFDMRKSLSIDVNNESVRENGRKFHVDPSEVWF